jgi:hypothetical protein
VCGCEEDEFGDRRHWEGEIVEPPSHGGHLEDCEDEKTCVGCWITGLHDPLPFDRWMVENLGADGGAVLVDGQMVDGWSRYQ